MERAIKRHEKREACIVPIILRPCDWIESPFGKLQVLPSDAKPVSLWPSQDAAFANIANGIRGVVKSLEDQNILTDPEN